jgi:hypothetical protein
MRVSIACALGLSLLGALATGCAPYGYYHGRWHHEVVWVSPPPRPVLAFAYHPAADDEAVAIEQAEQAPVYWPTTPAPPPSPRDEVVETTHARFDLGASQKALHAVDVEDCADRGAPRGYGHARVTFRDDGACTHVVIDAPAGLGSDAVACLGDRIGAARVAPFEGAPVTVGTTYYVP